MIMQLCTDVILFVITQWQDQETTAIWYSLKKIQASITGKDFNNLLLVLIVTVILHNILTTNMNPNLMQNDISNYTSIGHLV